MLECKYHTGNTSGDHIKALASPEAGLASKRSSSWA